MAVDAQASLDDLQQVELYPESKPQEASSKLPQSLKQPLTHHGHPNTRPNTQPKIKVSNSKTLSNAQTSEVEKDSAEDNADHAVKPDELELLKQILTGDQVCAGTAQQSLNDEQLSLQLAKLLPYAFLKRPQKDPLLTQALSPTIEEVFQSLNQQDPEALAQSLLPAIRRSVRLMISESLNEVISSLNRTLEYSLNLRWRLEAWRSGRSFAEVVLAHTLIYRVEQVF
ncbi:MAG: hypothetical protein R2865_12140 [Deinococcales bacterium]